MAMSAAQRRKADRDRKREQREAAAAAGRPVRVETVNAAIVEACAFALLAADQRTWLTDDKWVPINLSVVIAAATDILHHRHQFDRMAAKEAVVGRLRSRGRHKMSTSVPSINPDPGLPRYRTSAPDMAIRPH
ncbi:MAG: hypothetical protein ACOH2M_18620 [Cypionkella sp.]